MNALMEQIFRVERGEKKKAVAQSVSTKMQVEKHFKKNLNGEKLCVQINKS